MPCGKSNPLPGRCYCPGAELATEPWSLAVIVKASDSSSTWNPNHCFQVWNHHRGCQQGRRLAFSSPSGWCIPKIQQQLLLFYQPKASLEENSTSTQWLFSCQLLWWALHSCNFLLLNCIFKTEWSAVHVKQDEFTKGSFCNVVHFQQCFFFPCKNTEKTAASFFVIVL